MSKWFLKKGGVHILLFIGLIGCHSPSLKEEQYVAYLNDASNGLTQYKIHKNNLKISIQYRPGAYLAYGDLIKSDLLHTKANYDSLKRGYDQNTTFYIQIESLNPKLDLRSLLHPDVENTLKISEALTLLDEQLYTQLRLQLENKQLFPSLCIRESLPGLNQKIGFIAVFPIALHSLKSSAKMCSLSFNDTFFGTGTDDFVYNLSDIQDAPEMIL